MPNGIDRKMIRGIGSAPFKRLNPIINGMAILNIPAYQVDDLWIWAPENLVLY